MLNEICHVLWEFLCDFMHRWILQIKSKMQIKFAFLKINFKSQTIWYDWYNVEKLFMFMDIF